MIDQFIQGVSGQIASFQILLLIVNIILHIIFAGAVARDAGQQQKLGEKPALVNGITWAFATLAGGVLVAALYWFIHHSTLTRR